MLEKKYQINFAFLLLQLEMLRAAFGEWGARGQGAASTAHGLGGEKSSPRDMESGQDAKQSHRQPLSA